MADSAKIVDPAFEGAGQEDGLEVWRIENFQPVRVPKSDVGKFYTGDSYIVLKDGHVIAHESRVLRGPEKHMQIYEKELLAVIHALESWKHYPLGADFTMQTDHQSLRYFVTQAKLSEKHLSWANFFSMFHIQLVHVAGKKNMTTVLKSGGFQYDVHFWLGKATSQDEAGTAAIKTVELDAVLDDRAVEYREVQGHETDKFLSYFKPCIIPLEGGVASGFKQVETEKFEPRLYTCKGRRAVRVKQVPFSQSTLNHDDVFILDTESKIYQFNGSTSSIQERAKALEVVQYIKETHHDGTCNVAVIDDGELDEETDAGEFWDLFGGFGPIGNRESSEEDHVSELSAGKLYIVQEGKLNEVDATPLTKDILESSKCFVLDCGAELYVWTGRMTSLEERKAAIGAAEELLSSQNRPKHTHVTRVIEGLETLPFRTNFDLWPTDGEAVVSQDSRATPKPLGVKAPKEEEVPPLFNSNGKLEVWRINGSEKTAVPPEKVGQFFGGDCYIVLYTLTEEQKDNYFLWNWFGKSSAKASEKRIPDLDPGAFASLDRQSDSTALEQLNGQSDTSQKQLEGTDEHIEQLSVDARSEEDQTAASQLVSQSAGGKTTQGRIMEGNEPPEFIGLFQGFFLLKGGLSAVYKKKLANDDSMEETYSQNGLALFQVQGTGPHNSKAIQVSQDAPDLNSCHCYILQSGTFLNVWNGSSTSPREQEVAVKLAEALQPGSSAEIVNEESEPSEFWNALGGRKNYSCHPVKKEAGKHPQLFACSIVKGKLEATEVFNFTQNDLLSEDVMILDTSNEVFAWVGENADLKEKQQAFEMAEKYVEQAAVHEGLKKTVPIYIVTEGNEPFFFCKYFKEWDAAKASMQGDSFQKRLSILLGRPAKNSKSSSKGKKGEAMEALSSSLSGVKLADSAVSPGEYISYERLKASADDPAPGVDPERREAYLAPEEFKELFGMDSDEFYELPKWKQEKQKKALNLF
ncbi:hypothetical protein L7F22_011646 [Adiantum nelumboides]|nr:hypothetical protein [Adiantum nelumboides]